MPRMLRRAAVMGTAVHVANKRGQATGQEARRRRLRLPKEPAPQGGPIR